MLRNLDRRAGGESAGIKPLRIACLGRTEESQSAFRDLLQIQAPKASLAGYSDLPAGIAGIPTFRPTVVLAEAETVNAAGLKQIRSLKDRFPALPIVLVLAQPAGVGVFLSIKAG